MDDRIYFASARDGGYHSINALSHAFGDDMKKVRENGVVYILEEMPEELAPFLVIDEDCLEEAKTRNEEIKEREWKWHCNNAKTSLDLIGSFGIKHAVPRKILVKMSVNDFCKRFQVDCF
jgi:ABC-type dipeptide/oligopeptide/nickel transport system ATPase component